MLTEQYYPSRTWAEIDLDILGKNMQEIRRITSSGAEIMAVVKADAYGHGACQTAGVLLENGATRLAVSMIDEAVELRKHGICVPILVLNQTDTRRIADVISYDLTLTVYDRSFAEQLSAQAKAHGHRVKVHIKLDTGMGRIGYQTTDEAISEIMQISLLPCLEIEGLFSHFATSDEEDNTYVYQQFEKFMDVVRILEEKGLHIRLKHVCNSAGILRFPEMHLDMVRAGLIMYGMYPKGCPPPYQKICLHPAMTLKSGIIHVKTLPMGSYVSYGRKFMTQRESVIATIPIGYADGYSRRFSNCAQVLLQGRRAPIIGNICMDMCMIDVTDFPVPPKVSDEVILFGYQKIGEVTYSLPVDELSDMLETINYEITCLVGKRVPRVYLQDGKIDSHTQLYMVKSSSED